eukprot:m.216098 g.216098  ORF g.216098 m.216098 type:complete len:54 (+) comp54095_c1_seq1:9-170(+)
MFEELLYAVLLALLLVTPTAEAMAAGDIVALLFGLVIGILGICACIGWYANRR